MSVKGWLDGTMEVISGMAPRPSTPQPSSYPARSAPGSPKKTSYPLIQRVPSHDAMERSMHNDSGHGKTKDQVIKDLKASNSALTAKMADMEANFMNELNKLTLTYEEKNRSLEESLQRKDQQVVTMEARVSSTENRIRDRDTQVSKLKEETAFQRHAISDLKNQLYQLQHEIEDAEYDKRDGSDKWGEEKQEMVRELEQLRKQLKELKAVEGGDLPAENGHNSQEILQNWKQLEETKEALSHCTKRLHESQSALANAENDSKRLVKQHGELIASMKAKHVEDQAEWSRMERDLKAKIESLEGDGTVLAKELRAKLEDSDATISSLREEVTQFSTRVAELTSYIAKVKTDSDNRDCYRRDEADDLRLLNDAQQEEIERLKMDVDECQREISDKDEALMEKQNELEEQLQKYRDLTTELKNAKEASTLATHEGSGRVDELEEQLHEARETLRRMEDEMNETSANYEEVVADLRKEVNHLIADRNDVESRLASIEEERDQVRQELEKFVHGSKHDEEPRSTKRLRDVVSNAAQERGDLERIYEEKLANLERSKREEIEVLEKKVKDMEEEPRSVKRLRDVVSSAAQERAELERSFEEKLANLERSKREEIEGWEKKVKDMEDQARSFRDAIGENPRTMAEVQAELTDVRRQFREKTEEVEALKVKLRETENQAIEKTARSVELEESSDEVKRLREKVKSLEIKSAGILKAKKQLREAQIALIALDDDKKKLMESYREKISALRQEKEDIELARRAKVAASELVDPDSRVADLEKEIEQLKNELQKREGVPAFNLYRSGVMNGQIDAAAESALRKELSASKEAEAKLAAELESIKSERDKQVNELKEKLDDRDTTISALVKSSVTQEQKLSSMKSDLDSMRRRLDIGCSPAPEVGRDAVRAARDANYIEEIEYLRSTLDEYKEVEEMLSHEVSTLKRKLFESELEVKRSRSERDDESISGRDSGNRYRREAFSLRKEKEAMMLDHQEKIQERDSAIATLVNQSMSQETLVSQLQAKISSLKADIQSLESSKKQNSGPSWEELHRLQTESEIFAGQIIEQDEEMEALKGDLQDRAAEITSLKQELSALQRKANSRDRDIENFADLQAELDEIQEANHTQRVEIRELRKQLRDAKVLAESVGDLKAELSAANKTLDEYRQKVGSKDQDDGSLRKDLEEAIASKAAIETKLTEQIEAMRRLNKGDVEKLEAKLKEREIECDSLRQSSKASDAKVESLQAEIDKLKVELEKQAALADDAQVSIKDLRTILDDKLATEANQKVDEQKALLEKEVAELKAQLHSLEEDRASISLLKKRLAKAEEGRASIEQSYERKMSLLKLDKDVTIDTLRKELTEAKGRNHDDVDDLKKRIRQLEAENKDIKDELEAKLQLKNTKIFALEQTLSAQVQLVESMRAEMDQLQSNMERTTISRRAEIEEMQQEVLDSSAKNTKQEREITALKMQLEECRLEQKAQAAKWKDKISAIERSPLARSVAEQHADHRLNEIKERLEQVKWRNTSLQEENVKLRTRLEKSEAASRDAKNDKYRLTAMEEELTILHDRVKELEEELSSASITSTISRNPASKSQTKDSGSRPPTKESNSKPPTKETSSKPPTKETTLKPPTREASTPRRSRNAQSASPMRTPASPGRLRFLKRRSHSKDSREDAPPVTQKDDASDSSKLTF